MARVRALPMFLVVLVIVIGVDAGVVSRASAGEWPTERQFVLVEPPAPSHVGPATELGGRGS